MMKEREGQHGWDSIIIRHSHKQVDEEAALTNMTANNQKVKLIAVNAKEEARLTKITANSKTYLYMVDQTADLETVLRHVGLQLTQSTISIGPFRRATPKSRLADYNRQPRDGKVISRIYNRPRLRGIWINGIKITPEPIMERQARNRRTINIQSTATNLLYGATPDCIIQFDAAEDVTTSRLRDQMRCVAEDADQSAEVRTSLDEFRCSVLTSPLEWRLVGKWKTCATPEIY
jgi:hypothetical protein